MTTLRNNGIRRRVETDVALIHPALITIGIILGGCGPCTGCWLHESRKRLAVVTLHKHCHGDPTPQIIPKSLVRIAVNECITCETPNLLL